MATAVQSSYKCEMLYSTSAVQSSSSFLMKPYGAQAAAQAAANGHVIFVVVAADDDSIGGVNEYKTKSVCVLLTNSMAAVVVVGLPLPFLLFSTVHHRPILLLSFFLFPLLKKEFLYGSVRQASHVLSALAEAAAAKDANRLA